MDDAVYEHSRDALLAVEGPVDIGDPAAVRSAFDRLAAEEAALKDVTDEGEAAVAWSGACWRRAWLEVHLAARFPGDERETQARSAVEAMHESERNVAVVFKGRRLADETEAWLGSRGR
ncbi:hypothetical protein ACFC1B_07470 [Streptomyces xiamenensis]|uniref:hypothetical protein n=1 Tax=Streptomyces xiamenensis TaxID=408015 RepID=UPI0035D671B5